MLLNQLKLLLGSNLLNLNGLEFLVMVLEKDINCLILFVLVIFSNANCNINDLFSLRF